MRDLVLSAGPLLNGEGDLFVPPLPLPPPLPPLPVVILGILAGDGAATMVLRFLVPAIGNVPSSPFRSALRYVKCRVGESTKWVSIQGGVA